MRQVVAAYNSEVLRRKADPDANWPEDLKWSRDLKLDALRGRLAEFSGSKIRPSLLPPLHQKVALFRPNNE